MKRFNSGFLSFLAVFSLILTNLPAEASIGSVLHKIAKGAVSLVTYPIKFTVDSVAMDYYVNNGNTVMTGLVNEDLHQK